MPNGMRIPHSDAVYQPCMTVPVSSKYKPLLQNATYPGLHLIKNILNSPATLLFLCCPTGESTEKLQLNHDKKEILQQLYNFRASGNGFIQLDKNGNSVCDEFEKHLCSHSGEFTTQDQALIKKYCSQLISLISPEASKNKQNELQQYIGKIEKVANTMLFDIELTITADGSATPLNNEAAEV